MQHSPTDAFVSTRAQSGPALKDAIAIARRSVSGITDQKIDAVALCRKQEDGSWQVVLDVIDSRARLGENDLLAAFEVHVDPSGEVIFCSRTHRYRREDGAVS